MKPSELRPGDRVLPPFSRTVLTFVKRIPRSAGRQAQNVFHAPEYVGLNGPDDKGQCVALDYDLRSWVRV